MTSQQKTARGRCEDAGRRALRHAPSRVSVSRGPAAPRGRCLQQAGGQAACTGSARSCLQELVAALAALSPPAPCAGAVSPWIAQPGRAGGQAAGKQERIALQMSVPWGGSSRGERGSPALSLAPSLPWGSSGTGRAGRGAGSTRSNEILASPARGNFGFLTPRKSLPWQILFPLQVPRCREGNQWWDNTTTAPMSLVAPQVLTPQLKWMGGLVPKPLMLPLPTGL